MKLLVKTMKLRDSLYTVTGMERSGDTVTFRLRLNASHVIYGAHFPGRPITPGVCQLQMVTDCLGCLLQKKVYADKVKNIKYLTLVSPKETEEVTLVFNKIMVSETEVSVQAVLQDTSRTCSKFSVHYTYQPD